MLTEREVKSSRKGSSRQDPRKQQIWSFASLRDQNISRENGIKRKEERKENADREKERGKTQEIMS